jgi:hypothetical protein
LLTLAVSGSRIDGQLITHDSLAAGASSQLNAPDLRWKLAALSHVRQALGRSFGVRCDETVNLGGRNPPRRPNLNPRQLAAIEQSIDRRARDPQRRSSFRNSQKQSAVDRPPGEGVMLHWARGVYLVHAIPSW